MMLKSALSKPCKTFNIKGFQGVSLLEWEGKITSILFLPECNLRCPFCHASALVANPEKLKAFEFDHILDFLRNKKSWVDGVAISGGEPTIHEWLFDLIDEIRGLGLEIMIETNGTYPNKIKELIDTKRLDFIAMDIKAPLGDSGKKYKDATAFKDLDIAAIKKSIKLIMASGIGYEFRTTVVPALLHKSDVIQIAEHIKGAKKLALQQFLAKDTLDPAYAQLKPYPKKLLEEMADAAREFVDTVVIRNE